MLKIHQLSKSFGRVQVLRDLDLHLASGEAIAITGDSGCGKTTLLRLVAGLDQPSAGSIELHGEVASKPGYCLPPHKRGIACVFQEPRLWPHMRVTQIVAFGLHNGTAMERQQRIAEVAELTGISELLHRYPAELSGGQARRVALARALAGRQRLILMDEPLTNLHPQAAHELLECIRTARSREGFALVYVTHNPQEADALGINRRYEFASQQGFAL